MPIAVSQLASRLQGLRISCKTFGVKIFDSHPRGIRPTEHPLRRTDVILYWAQGEVFLPKPTAEALDALSLSLGKELV